MREAHEEVVQYEKYHRIAADTLDHESQAQ